MLLQGMFLKSHIHQTYQEQQARHDPPVQAKMNFSIIQLRQVPNPCSSLRCTESSLCATGQYTASTPDPYNTLILCIYAQNNGEAYLPEEKRLADNGLLAITYARQGGQYTAVLKRQNWSVSMPVRWP